MITYALDLQVPAGQTLYTPVYDYIGVEYAQSIFAYGTNTGSTAVSLILAPFVGSYTAPIITSFIDIKQLTLPFFEDIPSLNGKWAGFKIVNSGASTSTVTIIIG